jgi:hypothetical protein
MTQPVDSDSKVQRPAHHFAEPHHVVQDPALSADQKADALDSLEQDARQLSEASSEGMHGGERSKLHDVLGAKDALAASAVADAYRAVLQDLQLRQRLESAPRTGALLDQAIVALTRLAAASDR